MEFLTRHWNRLHMLSKWSIVTGATLMVVLLYAALIIWWVAPHSNMYIALMSVYHGFLEAAPACFASGACGGLIGDMMLRNGH